MLFSKYLGNDSILINGEKKMKNKKIKNSKLERIKDDYYRKSEISYFISF
jgi:hypothetical protein